MMTYQQTLDYMFSSLPAYHLVGKAAYKADLSNAQALMEHLGHPEQRFRSIHVAGTNGKGSVSHLLASVLARTGLRVGLYTSPHLVDFRERIRINGEMISQDDVVRFIADNKAFFHSHALSFFEMTVGLAFHHFASQQVDIAIIEVGLGGRLDATNVITPLLSVITNIGLDHTQFLGTTLPEIASEKSGIIKPGIPVVIGETHPLTKPVFEAKAEALHAPITFADSHYTILPLPSSTAATLHFNVRHSSCGTIHQGLVSPLSGSYQLHNLATLMQALECLTQQGMSIPHKAIAEGIANVVADTGLHGRWECFGERPLLICETAHNEDGVRAMLAKLSELSYRELHLIYGCVNDKDFAHILQLISTVAFHRPTHFHFTQPSVPRRLPVDDLATAARALGLQGSQHTAVADAIAQARAQAHKDDLILVTGSIFLIADAVQALQG